MMNFANNLAFPHLFLAGIFGHKIKRSINLRPVKHLNQRLLHFSQKCASDTDYISFARSFLQNLSIQVQINVTTPALKAGFFNMLKMTKPLHL